MRETFICTKERPWTPSYGAPAQHPDACDVGECSEGCCDKYRCPNCNLTFLVELPQ